MLLATTFCIFSQNIKAQRADINFGNNPTPVPSVSSLASYNSVPQTNATGQPGISYPLLNLPSRNKNISLAVSLAYNVLNTERDEPASDIGTGWSLFAGGVISRNIVDFIDEYYDDGTDSKYKKNEFNDIYYYNAPGISGKFRFIRNIATNTFELVNLSANKVKIEYTRNSNTATLILNSFTITDTKGNKFYFNDYSRGWTENHPFEPGNPEFRSAFYLTRIVDAGNVELANFTYDKRIKYQPLTPNWLEYEYCKLKSINSPGFGKIEFYHIFAAPWRMNDPFQIEKIILKDQNNRIINQYAFEYTHDQIEDGQLSGGMMEYIFKRMLSKIKKLDKNNAVLETSIFEYKPVSYTPINLSGGYPITSICPDYIYQMTFPKMTRPILKSITNPLGGVSEYNFEYGTVYKNRTDPTYLSTILNGTEFIDDEVQFVKPFGNVLTADTRQNINFPLTITGTGIKKIFASLNEADIDPPLSEDEMGTAGHLDFQIMKNGAAISGFFCNYVSAKVFNLNPGDYTIRIFGKNGKQGIGSLFLYEISHIPQPFPNIKSGEDLRINNIKYYNSITDQSPLKTTKFEYNDFVNPVPTSTGYYFLNEMDAEQKRHVVYKNVKVIDDTGGYIKYFYKTPDDYPKMPYSGGSTGEQYWPYYNLTDGGLLDKMEVYNATGKLLSSEQNQYIFEDVSTSIDYPLFATLPKTYSKPSWLKKLTKTATAYFENGRSIEETSETDFGVFNFKPIRTKKIVDGKVEEQITTYPETEYSNLSSAHILDVPVVAEEKIDGKLISRTETKFANSSSVYPTSVMTSNIGNTAQKTATIDIYDEVGNVIQYTDSNGNITTTIYGYNKTLPIAKIERAAYSQVSSLVQAIITAADADAVDPTKEPQLLAVLDAFRNNDQLKDFQITTYTYDPLIGATTITPPNGIREIYKYDIQNRLEKVVDMKGMILKEYKYNYKN